MFRHLLLFLVSLLLQLRSAYSVSSTGSDVLVLLEPKLKREQFSTFFSNLEDAGYNLTFRAPKDAKPLLIQDDVPNFHHLIVFAPTTKSFSSDITPQSLVTLLEHGVNILVALSPSQTPMHTLAAEFGLILPPPHTPLISHFPERSGPRDIVPVPLGSSPVLQKSARSPGGQILFKGIPFAYTSAPNPRLFSILQAPEEAFAADAEFQNDKGNEALADAAEKGGEGLWAGSSLSLVSGFIANNGARVLWTGGVDIFSDEFAKADIEGRKAVNADFSQDIALWAFQETLALRIGSVIHHLAAETPNATHPAPPKAREMYTINDRITYTIFLETYSPSKQRWVPFALPPGDVVQISYTMLDPHIRVSLTPIPERPGHYTTTFRAPDRHGVFKFAFEYRRKGYTHLANYITTSLVPPRHDGHPRFLSAAWPYYAGAISTSLSFILFCALWLGGDAIRDGERGKKKRE